MFSLAHGLSRLQGRKGTAPSPAEIALGGRRACDRFVRRARLAERLAGALAGLGHVWALALGAVAVALAADLALAPGRGARIVAALAIVAATGLLAATLLARLVKRRPSDRWLSGRIEARYPSLDGRLLAVTTYKGRPSPAVDVLAPEVARELGRAWALAVPSRAPVRGAAILALLATELAAGVLLVYGAVAPAQLGRASRLEDEPSPFARAELVAVRPGAASVVEGKPLDVSVGLSGDAREAKLLVLPRDPQARADARPIALERRAFGRYEARIPALLEDARYQVVLDGECSSVYPIDVIHAPRIVAVTHRDEAPAYLGIEPRETQGGDVDAIEGTVVSVRATTSSEPLRGKLRAVWPGDGLAETIPLTVTGPRALEASFVARHGGSYRLEYEDATGLPAKEGALYTVAVRPDLPPRAEILAPAGDREIAHSGALEVEYEARDDHGLGALWLHLVVRGAKPRKIDLPLKDGARLARGKLFLSPRSLGLLPGDSAIYYLVADDKKEPYANRGTSPPYVFVVEDDRALRETLTGIDAQEEEGFKSLEATPPADPEGEDDIAKDVEALKRLERLVAREPNTEDALPEEDSLRELAREDDEALEKSLEDLDLDEESFLVPPQMACPNCKRIAESSGKCPRCGRVNKCGTCGQPGHGRGCFAPPTTDGKQGKGEKMDKPGGMRPKGMRRKGDMTPGAGEGGERSFITRISRKDVVQRYRELLERRRELLRKLAEQVAAGRGGEALARRLGPDAARLLDALRQGGTPGPSQGSPLPHGTGEHSGHVPQGARAVRVREEIPRDSVELSPATETSEESTASPLPRRAPGWDEKLTPELRAIVRAYFERAR
jgi:hypothetical protein